MALCKIFHPVKQPLKRSPMELVLVVDFSTKQVSLVVVDPKTGNISVQAVQDYTKPGV